MFPKETSSRRGNIILCYRNWREKNQEVENEVRYYWCNADRD